MDDVFCQVMFSTGDKDFLSRNGVGAVSVGYGLGGERTYVCERQVEEVARLLLDFFQTGKR